MVKINYLIEEYYDKIMPEVNLVSSYLDDPLIKDIIIRCRLKPYKYNARFNRKLILRTHWIDEFNNSIFFNNKKIKIIENDLIIDKKEIKQTDVYYGLSINKISKISKKAYLVLGKDEDVLKEYANITLLGIDGFLRNFMLYDGEWFQCSPLSIGIDNLYKIMENLNLVHFRSFNKKNKKFPVLDKKEWITSLPVHNSFWEQSNINKKQLYFLHGEK